MSQCLKAKHREELPNPHQTVTYSEINLHCINPLKCQCSLLQKAALIPQYRPSLFLDVKSNSNKETPV